MARETVQGLLLKKLDDLALTQRQHGETLTEIKLQTQRTNGRVTSLEDKEKEFAPIRKAAMEAIELLKAQQTVDDRAEQKRRWMLGFTFKELLPWILSVIMGGFTIYMALRRG